MNTTNAPANILTDVTNKVKNRTRTKDSSKILQNLVDSNAPSINKETDGILDEINQYLNYRFNITEKDAKELQLCNKRTGPDVCLQIFQ